MEGLVGAIMEALRAEGEARGIAMGRAEGEARGIEMGRAEGMAEGRRRDLTRLLERRFGPLPGNVTRRIADADTDRLDRWFDRVLDADGLAAVFGD